MKILLTGATGFVGQSLVSSLLSNYCQVAVMVRQFSESFPKDVEQIPVGDLTELSLKNPSAILKKYLGSVDVVVHTAARVHMMNDDVSEPLTEFRKINRDATMVLARLAAELGVKRFVFLSSIKVNGEMTRPGHFFKPDDVHVPEDPYALSKYEAEQELLALTKEVGMDVVTIRIPLVYGPGVKANFSFMMKCVNKGIPLPLGAVHNKRSLVALDNLVDFIIHCCRHPRAANEVFIISDNEDVSTTELLKKLANAFGKQGCLLPIPTGWINFSAKLLRKEGMANRLFGSLQVDSSKASDLLNWKPVTTMDEQLKKTVDVYLTKSDD